MILKFLRKVRSFYHKIFKTNNIKYWENRAAEYGSRAVLNLAHGEDEFDKLTIYQKNLLFPILKKELQGHEKTILDFGCGPGRFSKDLAELIGGKCIGVDPIELFLTKNNKDSANVEYKVLRHKKVPLPDESFDVIWICLVLGGITSNSGLKKTIDELNRVLKKGGLMFLVENVSEKVSGEHWKFRSFNRYRELLSSICLIEEKGHYFDMSEKISIMSGRKGYSN